MGAMGDGARTGNRELPKIGVSGLSEADGDASWAAKWSRSDWPHSDMAAVGSSSKSVNKRRRILMISTRTASIRSEEAWEITS
jgi:hypothetical protein